MKHKDRLIEAIGKELIMRKDEPESVIDCIYFGGGTPSLLTEQNLDLIFTTIYSNFDVLPKPEITIEVNPDDVTEDKLRQYKNIGINRLSLGVQSFFDEDLKVMNRAHNSSEAKDSIALVKKYFDNYSIDLIYGMPNMDLDRWAENLEMALDFNVPHLSCYALTVEPDTALKRFIEKDIISPVDDEQAALHFEYLYDTMTKLGFVHYEFSNFSKPGYFSQNNQAYWTGKGYLGIGPSAHSFNGKDKRTWNVKHNIKYMKAIEAGHLDNEQEKLSKTDQYNEFLMTRLRIHEGVDLDVVQSRFGKSYLEYLILQSQPHLDKSNLIIQDNTLSIAPKAKFLSDGIAADLFKIEFEKA